MRSRLDKCKLLWCAKLSINFKKIIMRKFLILLFLFPLLLTSCGGRGAAKGEGDATAGEVDSLLYARNLSLERFIIGDNNSNGSNSPNSSNISNNSGIYIATVRNPWDTAKTLQRYILIPRGMEIPEGLPKVRW